MSRVFICRVLICFSVLVVSYAAQNQLAEHPLFSYFPSDMVCSDISFVALASVKPPELVVIRIDENGIGAPQRMPLPYNDVYGMKCNYEKVELLVRAAGSDHFSRLPFTISNEGVQQNPPEEFEYSIAGNGPEPPEINDFYKIQQQLRHTVGDWRIRVNTLDPKRRYELQFVKTEYLSRTGLVTRFSVTLVQETFRGQVLKSVPLVHKENFEPAD